MAGGSALVGGAFVYAATSLEGFDRINLVATAIMILVMSLVGVAGFNAGAMANLRERAAEIDSRLGRDPIKPTRDDRS